jgi:hypothetical protein
MGEVTVTNWGNEWELLTWMTYEGYPVYFNEGCQSFAYEADFERLVELLRPNGLRVTASDTVSDVAGGELLVDV